MDNQQSQTPPQATTPDTPSGATYTPPPAQTPPPPFETPPMQQPSSKRNMLLILGAVVFILLLAGGGYYFMNMQQRTVLKQPVAKPSPTTLPSPTIAISASPSANASMSADWKTYTNTEHKFSIDYPSNYIVSDNNSDIIFSDKAVSDGPTPLDNIGIFVRTAASAEEFDALYAASKGADVPEAHHAVDVTVEKLRNFKVGNFDAVEYIRDGTVQKSNLGRGPIGYSQNVYVKLSPTQYLKFTNESMDPKITKERNPLFNQMIATFTVTK